MNYKKDLKPRITCRVVSKTRSCCCSQPCPCPPAPLPNGTTSLHPWDSLPRCGAVCPKSSVPAHVAKPRVRALLGQRLSGKPRALRSRFLFHGDRSGSLVENATLQRANGLALWFGNAPVEGNKAELVSVGFWPVKAGVVLLTGWT